MQEYRYGKFRKHFAKKAAAEHFLDSVKGRTVQVRYSDSDPGTSVLMERDLIMIGLIRGN